jgi:hypothetical protein
MDTIDLPDGVDLPDAAINAYLRLMELNMASWKPQVAAWLHSEDAEPSLKQLLALVPCSPTLH